MAKIIDKIVQSATEPSKNDLWLHDGKLQANLKGKWESIGGGSGGGVQIVDSIDKLDPNAKVGTLASVVIEGGIKKQTFKEIAEITPPMGSITNNEFLIEYIKTCPIVNEIDIDVPKNKLPDFNAVLAFVAIPEDITVTATDMIMLTIQSEGCAGAVQLNNDNSQLPIFLWDETTQTYIKNENNIAIINNLLSSNNFAFSEDILSVLIGPLTNESIELINDIVYFYRNTESQAEVYVKKENWEKIIQSDIDKVYSILNTKPDIPVMSLYGLLEDDLARSNIFYTCYLNNNPNIKLDIDLTKENYYAEFMFNLRATNTMELVFSDRNGNPLDIIWANGNYPIVEDGHDYVISIISGMLGVFVEFY